MVAGKYIRTTKIRRKASLSNKGKRSYLKGKTYVEVFGNKKASEIKKKLKINHANVSGKNNPMYGIKITGKANKRWISILDPRSQYSLIHCRVRKMWGSADKCENTKCSGKSTTYEWSNKSHHYTLNRKDWKMLCKKCHKQYEIKLGLLKFKGKDNPFYGKSHTMKTKAQISKALKNKRRTK